MTVPINTPLPMTDKLHSPEKARSFEKAFQAMAEEFFFGIPESRQAPSEILEEDLQRSGSLLFRPFMLAGSYPHTHIIALFIDENHPHELFGYRWPIWDTDNASNEVRDLALYFHAHLCELIGAYHSGTLTRHTEHHNGERVVWLTFKGSW